MKRYLVGVAVLLVLSGGYLLAAHFSGGAFPTPGLALGGAEGEMRRKVTSFWEDIQFKDFDHAATYHSPEEQADVDIPYMIERMFAIKPESLDVMKYEIVWVELDSTRLRARVLSRVTAKELTTGEVRQNECIFYFTRRAEGAPWYMNFETSLRAPERRDPNKKQ